MNKLTSTWEKLISQVPLFASLPHEEIRHLSEILRPYSISAGELLMREGEVGDRFYILLDGEMEIIKALETPDERLLAVRGPGTFIGEMSLMRRDGTRTASVRSRYQSNLLEMTRAEFNDLLHRRPTLAYDMLNILSTRLYESENATIRDLQEKNIQLTQAYQELQEAQAQIIEKEKIERELEVAREIQFGILPRNLPQHPGVVFDACITPTRAVGGDFYDFIPLQDDVIGIAMGDVSDHGVPSALFMALTVTLLRAETRRARSLQEVLKSVNRQLLEMNDANMFVTVLYGQLNLATHEFIYVRAGHELPILLNGHGEFIQQNKGTGMPLGLFDDPLFDEQTISLGANDTLLLYTDGATDAIDLHGVPYGKDRLQHALRFTRQTSTEGMCHSLFESIQEYSGEFPQYDDIALLSMHLK